MNVPALRPRVPALTDRLPTADEPRPRRWSHLARGRDVACLAVLLAMAMPMMACVAPAEGDETTADSEEPSDTDTPPADTDDPTGGEPGPGCGDAPVADASFAVELEGWPAATGDMFSIAASCTVTAVEEVDAKVVTTLECDDAGELRPATLRIAASPEGAPSWGSGDAVVLEHSFFEDTELETGIYRAVSLRRAEDQALLVAAVDRDTLPGVYLEPLVTTEDRGYCGWAFDDATMPMALGFALDGESLDLVSGQRGILPIPGETDWLAVDLAEATVGHCCHFSTWFRLLVRRVA